MNPFLSDERNTRAYRMRIAGSDYKAIAAAIGMSVGWTRRICERYAMLMDRADSDDLLAQFDPYISRSYAQKLVSAHITTVEEAMKLTEEEIRRLPLIGPKGAREIYEGLHGGANEN